MTEQCALGQAKTRAFLQNIPEVNRAVMSLRLSLYSDLCTFGTLNLVFFCNTQQIGNPSIGGGERRKSCHPKLGSSRPLKEQMGL